MKKLLFLVLILSMVLPFGFDVSKGSSNLWPFGKKCLVELETATWCGYCPVAEKALAQLESELDPSDLTIYSLHYKDQFRNSSANARMDAYGGVVGTPTAIFSGNDYYVGGDPKCKQQYWTKINDQLGKYSPFTIRLDGKVDEVNLKLTATVLAWSNLPTSDYHFTFLIGNTEAKADGDVASWVLREGKPNPTGTPVTFGELSVSQYTFTYQLAGTDVNKIFASFLIESFAKNNIYQYATWRNNQIECKSISPTPGSLLDDPPKEITFQFSDTITSATNFKLMDAYMNPLEAESKVTNNSTVTITPKKAFEHGKTYFFTFEDGLDGLKAGTKKTISPFFTFFEVNGQSTTPPPPDPPTPPTPDPPTKPKPAKLAVEPLGFNLGVLDKNNLPTFEFIITNEGEEKLSGKINSGCEFLKIEPETFETTPQKVKCSIVGDKVVPGKDYRWIISVVSNAGQANVGVNFTIKADPPVLKFDPEQVDFGTDPTKMIKISVTNAGGGNMVTKITPSDSWIVVAPDVVENSGDFMVAIDATQLKPGSYKGSVKLESTGAKQIVELPVSIEIPKPKDPTVIEMVVGNKLAIVNGNVVELKVAPQVIAGATLVPFRFVAECFNATVTWDASTKTVTMEFPSKGLKISISENKPEVTIVENGSQRQELLAVPARNIQGTLCVPIRFFAQVLGAKTDWDAATKKIKIAWLP